MSLARKIWGVDSANPVDKEFFDCVRNQLGFPKYWGRHLTAAPNGLNGLTKEEISFIRSKGIKVLPIYNFSRDTISYEQAQIAARNAVYHARRLGFPEGTVLFANVENFYDVDVFWILGWVETLIPTGYRSGFYNDPVKGNFAESYCQAAKANNEIAVQTFLWSSEPNTGATSERKAPKYKPVTPGCKANVWVWKYGREAKKCSIDTNLADERLLDFLY